MIAVSTNADEVAAAVNQVAVTLEPAIVREAVYPILKDIQSQARQQHRYDRRTGRLERAIRVELDESGGQVYIDDGLAPYGKYVHEGTRRWHSDPFLRDAFDQHEKALSEAVDHAVDQTISRGGL